MIESIAWLDRLRKHIETGVNVYFFKKQGNRVDLKKRRLKIMNGISPGFRSTSNSGIAPQSKNGSSIPHSSNWTDFTNAIKAQLTTPSKFITKLFNDLSKTGSNIETVQSNQTSASLAGRLRNAIPKGELSKLALSPQNMSNLEGAIQTFAKNISENAEAVSTQNLQNQINFAPFDQKYGDCSPAQAFAEIFGRNTDALDSGTITKGHYGSEQYFYLKVSDNANSTTPIFLFGRVDCSTSGRSAAISIIPANAIKHAEPVGG